MKHIDLINNFVSEYFNSENNEMLNNKVVDDFSIEKFKSVLRLTNTGKILDNLELLDKEIKLLELVTSKLFSQRLYQDALDLLDAADVIILTVKNNKRLTFYKYLEFKIKHIKALILNGLVYEAINNTHMVLNYFKDEKNIKNQENYNHILKRIKSLLSYVRKNCVQTNNLKIAGNLKIKEKKFDRKLILRGIQPQIDQDLLVLPQFLRFGSPSLFIIMGSDIREIKGLKKVIFFLKLCLGYIFNFTSKLLWNHSERVWQIISISSGIILTYTFLIYFNIIQVCQNGELYKPDFNSSLYFSIVSFTSLGYGDIQPSSFGNSRIIMGSEAILGFLCISLIIYLIGKKSSQ